MRLAERQRGLDRQLAAFRELWHPQPFREPRPAWCERWPALAAEVLALSDSEVEFLNHDGDAALALVAGHVPEAAALVPLADLPRRPSASLADRGSRWAWEIPGRKRAQIEAFAAAARPSGRPVLDWCGGKGHLGRLLALQWQVGVTSLDIDATLCADGRQLAARAGLGGRHTFIEADALMAGALVTADQHVVALHACGELHRTLILLAAEAGTAAMDIAPCCYHRGVAVVYRPLTAGLVTTLSRDDTRLAVTETVTASPRLARKRDREMAWKLGFDALRRDVTGDSAYQPFKPVPAPWFAGSFAEFIDAMAARQGLPLPGKLAAYEVVGWQRQREVMRLSIVRHAFRRLLETWLVLDLAIPLQERGNDVGVEVFCDRALTPRQLLVSARR